MILTEKEMGNRLRELRLKSGFSQGAVAEALCCSRSAYSYLEKGSTALKVDTLQRLAAIFQIPVDDFFAEAGVKATGRKRMRSRPRQPPEGIGDLSHNEKKLIAVLRVQNGRDPKRGLTEEFTKMAREKGGTA